MMRPTTKTDVREDITMKLWSTVACALAIAVAGLAPSQPASAQDAAGWVTLLDGSNLDNWNAIGNANWRLEEGAAQADKGSGLLVSKQSYRDFEIRAEVWVNDEANSGIFIRCSDPQKIGSATAYEANIFDQRPEQEYGTGSLVGVAKVSPMPKAGGHWNTLEITAKGSTFSVVFNGVRTVDNAQDAKFASGPIALQYGKGIVKFRKVQIKPL
jgi:hypothetical protein